MRVVGLDISLASTGFADITNLYPDAHRYGITSRTIKTVPVNDNPTIRERSERATVIENQVIEYIYRTDHQLPTLVVVEAPAYGAKFGDPHDRSGLWWGIVSHCHRNGLLVAEVSPGQVKQYATGAGTTRGANKVTKSMVVRAVNDRYDVGAIRLKVSDNDRADAIVLAAIGARLVGHPIDPDIPAANLRALTKIRLPEGITNGATS